MLYPVRFLTSKESLYVEKKGFNPALPNSFSINMAAFSIPGVPVSLPRSSSDVRYSILRKTEASEILTV